MSNKKIDKVCDFIINCVRNAAIMILGVSLLLVCAVVSSLTWIKILGAFIPFSIGLFITCALFGTITTAAILITWEEMYGR